MKRLTLLTILLVVVGLRAGFALEVKPSFELSAYGKVEWGIDLNDWSTGFKNTTEADLTVSLFAEDTEDTHKGEGDWYGEIEVSDIEVYFTSDETLEVGDPDADGALPADQADLPYYKMGDDLGVSAKIVGLGGKLAIGVYGDPDLGSNVDFVPSIEDDEDDDYEVIDDETSDTENDLGIDYSGGGTYVSYSLTDALMVGLEVVSELPWDDAAAVPFEYAAALDIQAKFAPLTINAGVNYGTYTPEVLGAGIKVAADTDSVDGWVGFDAQVTGGFDFEVGGGLVFTLMEGVTAAVDVAYGAGSALMGFDDLDVKVVFTEPAAEGLMDNFDLTVSGWLLDVPDSMEYEVIVDGGYVMGDWYPNVKVDFGSDANVGDEGTETLHVSPFLLVTVGIDFTGIPLTTVGLYWKNNDLLNGDIGDIVLCAKVTY